MPDALYIHIPFCKKKCSYCDFYSVAGQASLIDDYLAALASETRLYRGSKPETIYIGGGTPTFLTPARLRNLFNILDDNLDFSGLKEFTIEANPGTISREKLRMLKDARVNRLSIGVQSFNERHLKILGRIHSASRAKAAIERAFEAGFANVSVDIISGIPAQTVKEAEDDLKTASTFPITHISAYSLSYEEGTPLEKAVRLGILPAVSREDERRMYLQSIEILGPAGLLQYEISNFARKGFECRHNITYWKNHDYIGLGASAVSYTKGQRRRNVADVSQYIRMVRQEDSAAFESEELSPEKRAREKAIMSLRMTRGITRSSFQRETGFDIEELFAGPIEKYSGSDFLRYDGKRLALTTRGFLVANEILSEFV